MNDVRRNRKTSGQFPVLYTHKLLFFLFISSFPFPNYFISHKSPHISLLGVVPGLLLVLSRLLLTPIADCGYQLTPVNTVRQGILHHQKVELVEVATTYHVSTIILSVGGELLILCPFMKIEKPYSYSI